MGINYSDRYKWSILILIYYFTGCQWVIADIPILFCLNNDEVLEDITSSES